MICLNELNKLFQNIFDLENFLEENNKSFIRSKYAEAITLKGQFYLAKNELVSKNILFSSSIKEKLYKCENSINKICSNIVDLIPLNYNFRSSLKTNIDYNPITRKSFVVDYDVYK